MIPSRLPAIPRSQEIIDRAFRQSNRIQDFYKKDYLEKDKIKSIQKIQVIEAVARATLKRIVQGYPQNTDLTEFERNLAYLLFDFESYERTLRRLKWTMVKISELATEYIRKIKSANEVDKVDSLRKSFYGRFSSYIEDLEEYLDSLREIRLKLREIPYIDEKLPVVVIAGFPNVGKSMLISRITNLKPEIASYPFTTKRINLGILESEFGKIQVLDVPGILNRKKRNVIEKKALIAIEKVANLVIFIIDPTETCGYPVEEQEKLLTEIKGIGKKVIEVENKSDILKRDNHRLKISALTGEGIDQLAKLVGDEINDGKNKGNSGI